VSLSQPIYILDTNILVRLAKTNDPLHAAAQSAVENLAASGAFLHTVPQAFFEFWTVATRPIPNGGLGFTPAETKAAVDYFVLEFTPFADDPALLTYWRQLVARYGVSGKAAHDARFIAAMQALGLTHLLTFNDSDFVRYAAEGVTIVHPANVPANGEV